MRRYSFLTATFPPGSCRIRLSACWIPPARVALTLHTPPASVQFLRQQLKAAEMERSLLQKQEKWGFSQMSGAMR